MWFKNSNATKSILAIDHFHVFLYDPPTKWVESLLADNGSSRGASDSAVINGESLVQAQL